MKRIVKSPIVLYRDGVAVTPAVGEEFDFTDAELKDINEVNPSAVGHVILPEDAPVAVVKAK